MNFLVCSRYVEPEYEDWLHVVSFSTFYKPNVRDVYRFMTLGMTKDFGVRRVRIIASGEFDTYAKETVRFSDWVTPTFQDRLWDEDLWQALGPGVGRTLYNDWVLTWNMNTETMQRFKAKYEQTWGPIDAIRD